MINPIADITSLLYRRVAKPLIFRLPADTVHETMIATGSKLQQIKPLLAIQRRMLRYDDPILSQTLNGITYKTPVGLSAGLDKDAQIIKLIESVGFGFAECGSVTLQPYKGNPHPWYTRLPHSQSILVNAGLKSLGTPAVIKHISATYPPSFLKAFPVNISIAKTNSKLAASTDGAVADYVESFRQFEAHQIAQAYTLNISCPNTYGGEPFTTPELLGTLLAGIHTLNLAKPLFIKLPIDKTWPETQQLLDVAARYEFVKGITIGNLTKDRSSPVIKDPLLASQKGHLSGLPCREPSNYLLAHAYSAYRDRFIFSGVGGVFEAADVYEKIRLGASVVQLVTGLIFGGPATIGRINRDLAALLRADGFTSVSQAIGVDTAAYLRQHP